MLIETQNIITDTGIWNEFGIQKHHKTVPKEIQRSQKEKTGERQIIPFVVNCCVELLM